MSKYRDALERIASVDLDKVLEYLDYEKADEISVYGIHDYPNLEMSGDLETLLELVERAEKYDELANKVREVYGLPAEYVESVEFEVVDD